MFSGWCWCAVLVLVRGCRLITCLLCPFILVWSKVKWLMVRNSGARAPSDMQPIKQPFYFQPSCGVAGSRPDNQWQPCFRGQMGRLLLALYSSLWFCL